MEMLLHCVFLRIFTKPSHSRNTTANTIAWVSCFFPHLCFYPHHYITPPFTMGFSLSPIFYIYEYYFSNFIFIFISNFNIIELFFYRSLTSDERLSHDKRTLRLMFMRITHRARINRKLLTGPTTFSPLVQIIFFLSKSGEAKRLCETFNFGDTWTKWLAVLYELRIIIIAIR